MQDKHHAQEKPEEQTHVRKKEKNSAPTQRPDRQRNHECHDQFVVMPADEGGKCEAKEGTAVDDCDHKETIAPHCKAWRTMDEDIDKHALLRKIKAESK